MTDVFLVHPMLLFNQTNYSLHLNDKLIFKYNKVQ
jgi:hypothetical protein